MALLKCVKNEFAEYVGECKESKVKVDTEGVECVVLKGDLMERSKEKHHARKSCDCLILAKLDAEIVVIYVELRKRGRKLGEVKKKMETCYDLLQDVLRVCKGGQRTVRQIFALVQKGIRAPEIARLRSMRIHCREKDYHILPKPSPLKLKKLLERLA